MLDREMHICMHTCVDSLVSEQMHTGMDARVNKLVDG